MTITISFFSILMMILIMKRIVMITGSYHYSHFDIILSFTTNCCNLQSIFNTVAKLAILAVAVAAGDGYHLGLDN